jgi:hypothetical protein
MTAWPPTPIDDDDDDVIATNEIEEIRMSDQPPASAQPKRIQRKRTKGWKMPENAIYVGRPTKWGNPFMVDEHNPPRACVGQFRLHMEKILERPAERELLKTLRGKDLACWCPLDQPCHADVLLELANV